VEDKEKILDAVKSSAKAMQSELVEMMQQEVTKKNWRAGRGSQEDGIGKERHPQEGLR